MPDTERFNEPNPEISALAEATVPAAAMMVPGFWEAASTLPTADDFDSDEIGALWDAILKVRASKTRLTKTAVQRQLREEGWGEAKAFAALHRADERYIKLDEALAAVQVLLDRRLRRQTMRVLRESHDEIATVHNVQECVQRTERALSDLASSADGADGWVQLSQVKEDKVERLPTGFDDLDRVNGGLPVGELTIGAGRTGMGKSAFAASLMLNVAAQGAGVACFSLEMRTLALIHRMAAAEAYEGGRLESGRTHNPFYDDYEQGALNTDLLKRFEAAKARVQKLPMLVDDKRGRSLSQIRLGARRARMHFQRMGTPMKLLVVDHIGKVKPDRYTGSRHLDLGDITEELAAIGGELGVSVFALCQLAREIERGDDKRPQLHHLRESGRIEEDAHTIFLFYRPAYYDERAKGRGEEPDEKDQRRIAREKFLFETDVAKNRGGPIRRVQMFAEIGANAILDKADRRCALTAQGDLI